MDNILTASGIHVLLYQLFFLLHVFFLFGLLGIQAFGICFCNFYFRGDPIVTWIHSNLFAFLFYHFPTCHSFKILSSPFTLVSSIVHKYLRDTGNFSHYPKLFQWQENLLATLAKFQFIYNSVQTYAFSRDLSQISNHPLNVKLYLISTGSTLYKK